MQHRYSFSYFVVLGDAKSATATLATLLRQYPNVFINNPRSPGFFWTQLRYMLGLVFLAFAAVQMVPLRGQVSMMYANLLHTCRYIPALMHRYLLGLQLIYIA